VAVHCDDPAVARMERALVVAVAPGPFVDLVLVLIVIVHFLANVVAASAAACRAGRLPAPSCPDGTEEVAEGLAGTVCSVDC